MDGYTVHRGIRQPRVVHLLAIAAFASCFAGPSAWAQVYKCEDANGKVVYQNAACAGTGQQMDPSQLRPNATPLAPRAPASEPVREQRIVTKASNKARVASEIAAAAASAPAAQAAPASAPASASADKRKLLAEKLAEAERNKAEAERKKAEAKRLEAEQEKARLATVSHCDDDGCWDAAGRRYKGTGPTYSRASDGAYCRREGKRMECP